MTDRDKVERAPERMRFGFDMASGPDHVAASIMSMNADGTASVHAMLEGKVAAAAIDLFTALPAERDALREALLAVRPAHSSRDKWCWCEWARDIEQFGHEPNSVVARAALHQTERDG